MGNKNIGSAIKEGKPIARIADLASFKIVGSISDNYIDELHNGMTVIICINETQMHSALANIYPSVQNGIVSFEIALKERDNKLFRRNIWIGSS